MGREENEDASPDAPVYIYIQPRDKLMAAVTSSLPKLAPFENDHHGREARNRLSTS